MKYATDTQPQFYYPWLGEKSPPTGTQVNLLTEGRVLIRGIWNWSGDYVAWAPLPDPDHSKYIQSMDRIKFERELREALKRDGFSGITYPYFGKSNIPACI